MNSNLKKLSGNKQDWFGIVSIVCMSEVYSVSVIESDV